MFGELDIAGGLFGKGPEKSSWEAFVKLQPSMQSVSLDEKS